ncbi:hypothetical protein R3P38DRAFT_3181439 [Favolaschia claudopus]|uniref:Uncharacterized protein n=1 Tax=Favolaschia claudopus TaxID=2862362 RepID=A0AAW0CJ19_9AGAR
MSASLGYRASLTRTTTLHHPTAYIKQHRLLFARHAASAVIVRQRAPASSHNPPSPDVAPFRSSLPSFLFRHHALPPRRSPPLPLLPSSQTRMYRCVGRRRSLCSPTSSPFQPSRTKRRMRNLKLLGSAEQASSAPATEQKRDGTLLSSRRRAQVPAREMDGDPHARQVSCVSRGQRTR